MSSARTIRFEVAPADAGKRLDQVLAANVPGLSRTKARLLLELGGVFVDRARVKIASAVRTSDSLARISSLFEIEIERMSSKDFFEAFSRL